MITYTSVLFDLSPIGMGYNNIIKDNTLEVNENVPEYIIYLNGQLFPLSGISIAKNGVL